MSEQQAQTLLAHHGRSFHWAGRFMARDKLRRAAALYKLCRHIDDAVDEAPTKQAAHDRLSANMRRARTELKNLLAETSNTGIADELCYAALEELGRGVGDDIEAQNIADTDELLVYAYRVAGCVGILMCRILGVQDSAALPFAIDLGIAMQCTNIARDIGEDAQTGHCYIPRNWRDANGDVPASAILRLLDMAEDYYTSAEYGMAYLPAGAGLAILCAARVYRRIGCKIAKDPDAVFIRRIYVTRAEKALVTTRAIADCVAHKKFHQIPSAHDAKLHDALTGLPGTEEKAAQHRGATG